MSFSCGRVVQFFIVGLLHRKRSEGADDEEQTTIRSPRERSELGQTPTKTLQPQCQPQAGARLPPTKTKTKTSTKTKTLSRTPCRANPATAPRTTPPRQTLPTTRPAPSDRPRSPARPPPKAATSTARAQRWAPRFWRGRRAAPRAADACPASGCAPPRCRTSLRAHRGPFG